MTGRRDSCRQRDIQDRLADLFTEFISDPQSPYSLDVQQAMFLARRLQDRATQLQTPQERRQQAELDRMIHHPRDKVTLTQLTDQAFRSSTPHRAVDQLTHILDVQGIPRFFTPVDRALLKGFQSFGSYLPGVAVPLVKDKMHRETANVILPAETEMLAEHLRHRRAEGVRMNVNYLGEAILGEQEAERRLNSYLQALQIPEIEVVSVKISTIYSQISALAREHTVSVLCDRLELLFRAAAKERFTRGDDTVVPKFVYLDMEEYRDMTLTADAFMRTLDRPGLENVSAGIVLQAYIPDSIRTERELTDWARQRVARGGAPITLRIVKGANLEMERHEASVKGWPQAPFKSKRDTDANYKRMLIEAMRPDNLEAVRVGIASHNLFELSYGLVLAWKRDALHCIQFEMLEGMANHQRRALFELTDDLLLYAPACGKDQFIHAIGYLIRRLDENTGTENFLRYAFKLEVDSPDWKSLQQGFLESFDRLESLPDTPRRTQDRNRAVERMVDTGATWQAFRNEPDTDFSLPHNVEWAENIIRRWHDRCGQRAADVPLVIDGELITEGRPRRQCLDPSRPGVVVGRYLHATSHDIQRAVQCAKADEDRWRALPCDERSAILRRVAYELRVARGDLMGAALADGGKTIVESDSEVSEAVDFVEFYGKSAQFFAELPELRTVGRGVVVVVSPWNFPIAIPCGGVAAALAAGNTVILKPASDTVLVAHALCECYWRAGVSRKVLQLVTCAGADEGQQLVSHPDVDTVILTGGTETAREMLRRRTDMRLLAETGGKNATIVTALSDRDQAIKHVVHSAFSHGGQKCSATSLLILEEEVYHDRRFKEALCDAVASLEVGSAWDLKNRVGPLIRPPGGALERGLKELEHGESWAVMPTKDERNPNLYSPAVKWDVRPGSFTHRTELFGPVLGVMKAKNLHHAIQLANQTGYGLTAGLESLDDREQRLWTEGIRAGNLYVNRPTTGAIVLRQPFGGMGMSAFGPGIKAGGPNYVAQLLRFTDIPGPTENAAISNASLARLVEDLEKLSDSSGDPPREDLARLRRCVASYDRYAREEFLRGHDHFRLTGQDNLRRYLPVRELRVRVHRDDTWFEIFARVCAAHAVGCRVTLSVAPDDEIPAVEQLDKLTQSWAGAIEFVDESDDRLASVIGQGQTDRVRYAAFSRVPRAVRQAAAETCVFIADAPVGMHGRVELLWYVQEQSVSVDFHRYGNLGARANEERSEVR